MRSTGVIALLLGAVFVGCDTSGGDEAAVPTAASSAIAATDGAGVAEARCELRRPPFLRSSLPARFFPARASALWLAGSARNRCIYLIPPSGRVRPIWRVPDGERLARLAWAPDATIFVATTLRAAGARTYVVGRDGRRVRQLPGVDGVTFLRDGAMVVARDNALFLRRGRHERKLVSVAAIVSAAGVGRRATVVVAADVHGFVRGYGADAVAVSVFAPSGAFPALALVVVGRDGSVRRMAPPFAGGAAGSAAGRAWSPNGRSLAHAVGELPGGPDLPQAHEHCLDLWTSRRGYRRLVCGADLPEKTHFERAVWATDGSAILLDNGVVVTAGRPAGQTAVPPLAFTLQWTE